MVLSPGEQHGVGGGLRSLTAFLVVVEVAVITSICSDDYNHCLLLPLLY